MIIWFVYNLVVLLEALLIVLEKSYGISIGLLAPIAWILLPITAILLVQWRAMIQWIVIDILIILMSILVIFEKSFHANIGIISPIAWIVTIIMIVLIAKDIVFMKIKR